MSASSGRLDITIISEPKSGSIEKYKKITPAKPISINNVYVCNKTPLMATFKKCETLLNKKVDYVDIHGTGKMIPRAIRVANLLNESMKGSVKASLRTGTITVTDRKECANGENADRHRPLSVVHIRVERIIVQSETT